MCDRITVLMSAREYLAYMLSALFILAFILNKIVIRRQERRRNQDSNGDWI